MYQGIYKEPIESEQPVMPMDERMLRWVTVLLGILAVVVCACLYVLPEVRAQEVLAADVVSPWDVIDEAVPAEEDQTGELLAAASPEQVVIEDEDEEERKELLSIELPQGMTEDRFEVGNDYLTQTVRISFDESVEDYFAEYGIRGKREPVRFMSYYRDGEKGVLVLELNGVYELDYFCENGKLYMNFVDPHERYDKVIVVDAGHGGNASGATQKGTQEKDINLAMLLELQAILDEDERIGVYYTRTTDVNPTLDQRVQLANRANADLFISIHNNASATKNYSQKRGTLILYSESDQSELSSKRFARICADTVSTVLGSKNRGLLEGDNIYIIRNSRVPVALIEVGYMTQNEELELLKTAGYQHRAAEGIYQAILRAFEEGY